MRGETNSTSLMLDALVKAIKNIGSEIHVDSLVDLIGSSVKHDRVTVVRYSSAQRPEFISHRNFDKALVNKYLKVYYVHDPFYAHRRNNQKPGVFTLCDTTQKKRGPYILEFLNESVISDEVGVLLDVGANWCFGIFLDRSLKLRGCGSRPLRLSPIGGANLPGSAPLHGDGT